MWCVILSFILGNMFFRPFNSCCITNKDIKQSKYKMQMFLFSYLHPLNNDLSIFFNAPVWCSAVDLMGSNLISECFSCMAYWICFNVPLNVALSVLCVFVLHVLKSTHAFVFRVYSVTWVPFAWKSCFSFYKSSICLLNSLIHSF